MSLHGVSVHHTVGNEGRLKVSVPLMVFSSVVVWCLSYFNLRLIYFPQHPSPKKDSFL